MQWMTAAFICVYIVYTLFMMHLFGNIYKTVSTQEAGLHACLETDADSADAARFRGSTRYRTIAAQDLPQEAGGQEPVRRAGAEAGYEEPVRRLPQSLVVGFSKCGTSALLAFLDIHPDIVTVDWEVDYFCDRVYPKYSIHWYRMRMPPSTSRQTTMEKSPCYISQPAALRRIEAMNSSMKLIVIVRDPITRILSEHSHYLQGVKNLGKMSVSIEDRYMDKDSAIRDYLAKKWGTYADRMENLYQVFPREQILLVDGDEFVKRPLYQLRLVEQFLGVRSYFSERHFQFNIKKGFFCLRKPKDNGSYCMGKNKGRKHVIIDMKFREKLKHYLKPHTERFFHIVRRRFHWET